MPVLQKQGNCVQQTRVFSRFSWKEEILIPFLFSTFLSSSSTSSLSSRPVFAVSSPLLDSSLPLIICFCLFHTKRSEPIFLSQQLIFTIWLPWVEWQEGTRGEIESLKIIKNVFRNHWTVKSKSNLCCCCFQFSYVLLVFFSKRDCISQWKRLFLMSLSLFLHTIEEVLHSIAFSSRRVQSLILFHHHLLRSRRETCSFTNHSSYLV